MTLAKTGNEKLSWVNSTLFSECLRTANRVNRNVLDISVTYRYSSCPYGYNRNSELIHFNSLTRLYVKQVIMAIYIALKWKKSVKTAP